MNSEHPIPASGPHSADCDHGAVRVARQRGGDGRLYRVKLCLECEQPVSVPELIADDDQPAGSLNVKVAMAVADDGTWQLIGNLPNQPEGERAVVASGPAWSRDFIIAMLSAAQGRPAAAVMAPASEEELAGVAAALSSANPNQPAGGAHP